MDTWKYLRMLTAVFLGCFHNMSHNYSIIITNIALLLPYEKYMTATSTGRSSTAYWPLSWSICIGLYRNCRQVQQRATRIIAGILLINISALTLLVGWQEGHPACKKWGDGGGGYWLVQMKWLPAGWSVCLPLLIFPWRTHSPSRLAWSESWRPPGAQSAFIEWTGWTLTVTMVMRIAP